MQKVNQKEAKSRVHEKYNTYIFNVFELSNFFFPSIYLFVFHSVIFVYLYLFIYLSIFLFVYLFICLSICMNICLFCFLCVCLYISLSVYLSIYLLGLPAVIIKQLNIAEDNGGTVGELQIYAIFPAGRWQL